MTLSRTVIESCCPPTRCPRSVNRVVRSTSVMIAEPFPAPMIKSPSQCPGSRRSKTLTGRWWISVIPVTGAERRC
jgi:hypothetical protein